MTNERNFLIAHVCLTDGSVQYHQVDAAAVRRYLGGRGLGMHLLESSADQNPLIFLTGPLTDSRVPSGGRYCAVTRSAESGLPISLSSGTCWGAVLKRAGLDGIVIEGEAPEWAYLSIKNGNVQLHTAQPYVGMLSGETTQALKSTCGQDSAVLCIGPAGENLVPMAAILCNTERAFSRAGIGKNMGAKRLKAIAACAENVEDIPVNACIRCNVSCRNTNRENTSDFSSLCNAYGLDCVGAAQVLAAIGTLQACENGAADAAHWIPEISCPKTQLAKLAGEGAAALQRAYGTEPVVPAKRNARERAKQNVPEELAAVIDSVGGCLFSASAFRVEDYAQMITESTGERFSMDELMEAGTQILQLEQKIASCQPF